MQHHQRASSAAMPPAPTGGSERYQKLHKLGEGTYGVVFRAQDKVTGELVALKKVRMEAWDEGVPATAMREISILKSCPHPNIVPLKDVFVSLRGNLYLVFELLDRDLKQHMDTLPPKTGVGVGKAKLYVYQLLCGIDQCHSHRIIHRDIKPQNILIDGEQLKLADFGLARAYNIPLRAYTHEVVTLWYRAPEILLGSKAYCTPVDIWSVGCIFVEMLTGIPLFPGDSEIDELYKIFQVLGTPTEAEWPGISSLPDYTSTFPRWLPKPWAKVCPMLDPHGVRLVQSMLAYDPKKRITARDALQDDYFRSLRDAAAAGIDPRTLVESGALDAATVPASAAAHSGAGSAAAAAAAAAAATAAAAAATAAAVPSSSAAAAPPAPPAHSAAAAGAYGSLPPHASAAPGAAYGAAPAAGMAGYAASIGVGAALPHSSGL